MLHVCLSYAVLSVPCGLVINCCERADLLTLLCVMFACVPKFYSHGEEGIIKDEVGQSSKPIRQSDRDDQVSRL